MKFNAGVDKSAIVMFRLQGEHSDFDSRHHKGFRLRLGNGQYTPLPFTQSYKYLGVWFDAQGRTQQQFDHVCSKLRRASFFVTRVLRDVHPRIGIQLVNATIRSILSYGLAFWQPSSAQLYRFDSCMAIPLRRVLGLPNSTHTVSTLAACGIPCSRAILEHMQMRTAVRAAYQLSDDNPAHDMFTKALRRRYVTPLMKRAPLAARVKSLIRTGQWGDAALGLQQYDTGASRRVKRQLRDLCLKRGYSLWKGGGDASCPADAWSEKHHPTLHAPIRPWYVGDPRKQLLCEPSLQFDDLVTARLRARLRHGRASFSARRHMYAPSSRLYAADPNCPECGDSVPETSEHVLQSCPRFNVQRHQLDCELQSAQVSHSASVPPPPSYVSVCHAAVVSFAGLVPRGYRSSSLRSAWLSSTGKFLRSIHKLLPF